MADEIARLGVAVDSSTAVSAAKDLENLALSGDKATASATQLKTKWDGMTMSPTALFAANRGLKDFQAQLKAAQTASTNLESNLKKVTFNDKQLFAYNQALSTYKNAAAAAVTATQAEVKAKKILAESNHQLAKSAAGYTKTAKEMAFANRNLPAQFTDIFVSLQGGQNPMTVLFQQGGQLKDMFGGIGPAARAMGGYILGLVNPLSLAAAAVTALGVAYVKGEGEARAFRKELTLQGDSLGLTASDLIHHSEAMASWGRSQGKVSEALLTATASGKLFGAQIVQVTEAALNLERAAGQEVAKTVQDFASLGGKPLEAAMELDEKYKFLTVTVYEQIKALEEQGDTLGAQQVAMDALAGTINQRSADIESDLGLLQKAWRGVAESAKWAWDQMLNIGREDSVQTQIQDLYTKLNETENPGTFLADHVPINPAQRAEYAKSIRAQIMALQDEYVAQQREANRQQNARVAAEATIALDQQVRQFASNEEKKTREMAKVRETARRAAEAEEVAASAGWQDRVRALRENEAKALKGIEEKYKEKPKKDPAARDAERELRERERQYESLNRALDQHASTLSAAADAQDKLSGFERYALKALSDLENGHTKLSTTQQAEIKNRIEALRVIDQQNQAREKEAKVLALSADTQQRLNTLMAQQGQGLNSELLGVGRGQNEAALEQSMEAIRIRMGSERYAVEKRYQELRATGSAQYIQDLAAIDAAESKMLANEINQLNRRKAAMSDWRNGARSAMEDIAWQVQDTAGATRDGFMNAFSAMSSALDNFAKTGKMKIRDFATVVIAELMRIALTIAAQKYLAPLLQGFAGGGANTGMDASMGQLPGAAYAAKGAAFGAGGLLALARGGTVLGANAAGMVRSSPTLLPMANGGTALIGEHQAEGVFPLERDSNGKLGVKAVGGGGGTNIQMTTNVNINQNGTATVSSESTGDNSTSARKLGEMVGRRVREVLQEERRQGGLLWAMTQGR